MMDKKLKAKWVKALRSGKYKQCTSELYDSEAREYCCLGVLCVVAKLEPDANAYTKLDRLVGSYSPFVRMNDDLGKSFSEIADHIEKEY